MAGLLVNFQWFYTERTLLAVLHIVLRSFQDGGERGNIGVDRPTRLSCACFSLNKSFALTGMSFREHPFLSGAPCKFSFSSGFSY